MGSIMRVFVLLALCASTHVLAGPTYPVINPALACPNCDLNAPGRAICAEGLPTDVISAESKICVALLDNQTFCDNKRRPIDVNFIRPTNTSDNPAHCGGCDKKCPIESPACINGVCGCDATTLCFDPTMTCDLATQKCTKPCDRGLVRCSGEPCGVNVLNTTQHCGACNNDCGSDHTCVDGQCVCGDFKGRCPYPASTCLNGKCVECTSALDDSGFCAKRSIFDKSGFCNSTSPLVGGFCDSCPAGFGDCTTNNIDGLPDTGAPSDCETNLNRTGQVADCGSCGGACNAHAGQMCCSGQCKCGTFANLTNPSADECAAAQTCSTGEFCDSKLKRCIALAPTRVNCRATASSPFSTTNGILDDLPYCGSCDRAVGSKNIVNGTCMNSFSKCGGELKSCRSGQSCTAAKCECDTSLFLAFTWNQYINEDPDGDNKFDRSNRPASGCALSVVGKVLAGSFVRAQQLVLKLRDCGELAGVVPSLINSITPKDLKNETFLGLLCPANPLLEGTCAPGYCKDAVRNLTGTDRGDFCSAAFNYASMNKYCTQELRVSNNKDGDLTCANLNADEVYENSPTTISWMEMFTFLGCDKPREDFIWHFTQSDRAAAFMYRGEVAKILLGGSPLNAALGIGSAIFALVSALFLAL